jgi:diguanylate cyclase (GGDEF)-like protein/PAS domain S-box-containing protein
MVLVSLGFQVLLSALAVAWLVFYLITRPIKAISDELHRMEVRTGISLKVPRGHRRDEIGRLVVDVNSLIGELTGLIEAERRLRLEREVSERRLALIFDKVDAGMFETDRSGVLQHWNPAFVRTLGLPDDPPLLQSLIGDQSAVVTALLDECLSDGKTKDVDLELDPAEGVSRWVEISLTPIDDRTLQGVVNDITERKHRELAAHDLAARDALTGLFNRRGFDAELSTMFDTRSQPLGLQLALMCIDLDYFKQVNDIHGHEIGDHVLQHTARIFERAVRRSDMVARIGGDEFQIALVGIDSIDKAQDIATLIINEIIQPYLLGDGTEIRIGVSIGIAFAEPGDLSSADTVRRADRALYAAKQAGRCRYVLADSSFTTPLADVSRTYTDDAHVRSDGSGFAA